MKVSNQIPELGNIEVTPSYVYIQKNKNNEMIQIKMVGLPIGGKSKARKFVDDIEKVSGIEGLQGLIDTEMGMKNEK